MSRGGSLPSGSRGPSSGAAAENVRLPVPEEEVVLGPDEQVCGGQRAGTAWRHSVEGSVEA